MNCRHERPPRSYPSTMRSMSSLGMARTLLNSFGHAHTRIGRAGRSIGNCFYGCELDPAQPSCESTAATRLLGIEPLLVTALLCVLPSKALQVRYRVAGTTLDQAKTLSRLSASKQRRRGAV